MLLLMGLHKYFYLNHYIQIIEELTPFSNNTYLKLEDVCKDFPYLKAQL